MRKAMLFVLALVLFPVVAQAQEQRDRVRSRAAAPLRQRIARSQLEQRLRQSEARLNRLLERRQAPQARVAPRARVRPMQPSVRLRRFEPDAAARIESRRNQLESRVQRSLPRPPRPPARAGRRLRRWM